MFAYVKIDWLDRKYEVVGMEGDMPVEDEITLPGLVRMMSGACSKDSTRLAVVVYDDVNQLAFYESAEELVDAVQFQVDDDTLEEAMSELNVECKRCRRKSHPLHFNRLCPDCYEQDPDGD